MGTRTPASLGNPQQVGRNLNFLPLQRKPLAGGVRSHWVGVMADRCQKGVGHHLLCRGPNPVWAHWDRSACWFGRMISLCFLFQQVNLLWNHLLDRLVVTSKSQLGEAVCEHRAVGSRPAPYPTYIVKLPHKKIWSESSALDCEGLRWEFLHSAINEMNEHPFS